MADTDTAPEQSAEVTPENPLPGFEDAFAHMPGLDVEGGTGIPTPEADEAPAEQSGKPETAEAVDESEDEATTEETQADEAEGTKESAEQPESTPEVNFDGFSDDQKATFEELLKEGHVTPEFVEQQRLGALRHADYTRKTMALADQRKAWEKEREKDKEDYDLLEKIRSDDKLYARWLQIREQEPMDDESGDELLTRKEALELARQEVQRALGEKDQRTAAEQAAYDKHEKDLTVAINESAKMLGLDAQTLGSYLAEAESKVPTGQDPILYYKPEEVHEKLAEMHERAQMKQQIADLQKQLKKRTSRDQRAAKASLPPDRRMARPEPEPDSQAGILKRMNADLGLADDWSNVTGWGDTREK